MNHYDVLGASPDASAEELRAAYLAAARRCHPDTATGSEVQMRAVNAAWRVLGDPELREAYDLTLPAPDGTGPTGPTRSTTRPDATWVPYDTTDDVDPRDLVDDRGDPRTAPGRLGLLPVVVGGVTLLVAVFGLLTGERAVFVAAAMLAVLTVVSFLALPLAVLARSVAVERDADRRRSAE